MHGVALTMLLKKEDRAFLSTFSKDKLIDTIDTGARKHWNSIESLSYKERIAVGVLGFYHDT